MARCVCAVAIRSEITPEGPKVTKLDSILLNGTNIAVVRRSTTLQRAGSAQLHPHPALCVCAAVMGRWLTLVVAVPCSRLVQLVPGGSPEAK